MSRRLEVFGVEGLPEVQPGDDLGALIAAQARLRDGDVVVVAHKVVAKAEGRLRDLSQVVPSQRALFYAQRLAKDDPRFIQVVLDECVRVVRDERVLITETRQGFICANSGVDRSNVPGSEMVALLPEDPDHSAELLRQRIRQLTGRLVGVVVADTFGRAWRMGIANVALGVAGLSPLLDHRGQPDDFGRPLEATVVAVADELAAAAELVMGKTERVPVAVVRGWAAPAPTGRGQDLVRPPELDLFR